VNKIYPALLLTLSSFSVLSSGMLEELKGTPATKYELGLFKLESYVRTMSNKLEDERINNTKFKFKNATVREDNNQLQIVVTAIGRSKYLTESQCKEAKARLSTPFNTKKIPYNMWSGLSQESYKRLQTEISLNVTLMDKENSALTLTCQ